MPDNITIREKSLKCFVKELYELKDKWKIRSGTSVYIPKGMEDAHQARLDDQKEKILLKCIIELELVVLKFQHQVNHDNLSNDSLFKFDLSNLDNWRR